MPSKKITIRLDIEDLSLLHHVMQYRNEDSMSQAIRDAIRTDHKLLYNHNKAPTDYQHYVAEYYNLM